MKMTMKMKERKGRKKRESGKEEGTQRRTKKGGKNIFLKKVAVFFFLSFFFLLLSSDVLLCLDSSLRQPTPTRGRDRRSHSKHWPNKRKSEIQGRKFWCFPLTFILLSLSFALSSSSSSSFSSSSCFFLLLFSLCVYFVDDCNARSSFCALANRSLFLTSDGLLKSLRKKESIV